ncbi:Phage terminase, small subunit [Schinkia azotoformans MEV2011]|uniref:Phage terminase, small subunit n=1 Tax=Schinkia azotoformans MEV2011 TaxID=1348973 RepID=A0A072P3U9_SCHAZ|nr:Phage terminase, small subunit [Schinkia azotoformans MEV2011]
MPVNISKLQKQLFSRIDMDDLVEVEKVERYISLIKLNKQLDKEIKKEGATVITENGSQRFVKSHPAVNDKMKVNAQLLAIEKSFNFISEGATTPLEKYSDDDLI